METEIKKDLEIGDKINTVSGDGTKNNIKYEIKYSGHSKKCNFNFVQIRPNHQIDYYILVGYNLFENEEGKEYVLKIPSKELYDLIPKYGNYAHGTIVKNGKITESSVQNSDKEYCLRPCPNSKKSTKPGKLWLELKKYEVEYKKENF